MNYGYYKPSPDNLTDWIEDNTKNPERFHRLVNILKRLSNWADGTYNDGIKVKRGEIRITINQLAKKLGYSYDSTWNMLRRLQKAGWISIQNEYKLTIITLNWITHYNEESADNNSQPDNRNSKNPITESKFSDNKPDSKPDNRESSATINNANKPDNKPDSKPDNKISDSRYQNQAQPDIGNKRSIREVKESEINKENIQRRNNGVGDESFNESFEEKKDRLKKLREEVNAEIQIKAEGKEFTLKELEDTVRSIYEAFAKEYETRFGAPPALSGNELRLLKKRILDNPAYTTPKHLENFRQRAIAGIPAFFRLQDPWVRKQNYSFFAFIYRLNSVMPLTARPSVPFKGDRKEYLKALGVL